MTLCLREYTFKDTWSQGIKNKRDELYVTQLIQTRFHDNSQTTVQRIQRDHRNKGKILPP